MSLLGAAHQSAVLVIPKLRVRPDRPDVALKGLSRKIWRATAKFCRILPPLFPNCGIPDVRSPGRRRPSSRMSESCVTSIAGSHGAGVTREMKEGSFEVGNQVLISSHRKLLLSKAIVVNVVEGGGREYPAVSHGNGTAGRRKLGWRVNSGNPGGRRPQHQSRRSQSGPVIGVFPLSPES